MAERRCTAELPLAAGRRSGGRTRTARQPLYPVSCTSSRRRAARSSTSAASAFARSRSTRRDGRFALRINGTPIFCRGACWTAARHRHAAAAAPRPTRRDADRRARRRHEHAARRRHHGLRDRRLLRHRATSSASWSGRTSCSPTWTIPIDDPEFAASVDARSAHSCCGDCRRRPSLAVLCGSSEVEQQAAMLGLAARALAQRACSTRCLPALVARAARPDVPYCPSTPTGGALPVRRRRTASRTTTASAPTCGRSRTRDAPRCSFAAECLAFANVPDDVTFAPRAARRRDAGASPGVESARAARRRRRLGLRGRARPLPAHAVPRRSDSRCATPIMQRYLALSRVVTGEVMAQHVRRVAPRALDVPRRAGVVPARSVAGCRAGASSTPPAGRRPAYYYVKRALAPSACSSPTKA